MRKIIRYVSMSVLLASVVFLSVDTFFLLVGAARGAGAYFVCQLLGQLALISVLARRIIVILV
jgi:hypothetical protein